MSVRQDVLCFVRSKTRMGETRSGGSPLRATINPSCSNRAWKKQAAQRGRPTSAASRRAATVDSARFRSGGRIGIQEWPKVVHGKGRRRKIRASNWNRPSYPRKELPESRWRGVARAAICHALLGAILACHPDLASGGDACLLKIAQGAGVWFALPALMEPPILVWHFADQLLQMVGVPLGEQGNGPQIKVGGAWVDDRGGPTS